MQDWCGAGEHAEGSHGREAYALCRHQQGRRGDGSYFPQAGSAGDAGECPRRSGEVIPRQHQHLGLGGQRGLRDDDGGLVAALDGEVGADALQEAVERIGVEVVHRQDQPGAQGFQHLHHAGHVHGVAAVDRHHHHVELADLGDLLVGQRVVQVAQVADAHAGDLEDEDGVAVRDVAAAPVADVGGDVAHAHVGEGEVVLGHGRRRGSSPSARG